MVILLVTLFSTETVVNYETVTPVVTYKDSQQVSLTFIIGGLARYNLYENTRQVDHTGYILSFIEHAGASEKATCSCTNEKC